MVGYDKNDILSPNQKFIAGCVSGMTTRFITQPLDVVKLRTQLQKKDAGKGQWLRTTRVIVQEEGLTALWHGHNIGQMHSMLGVTSQFFVYEMSTKFVANTKCSDKQKKMLVFLSGIFAGCCSATLIIPLEVVRVRQMLVKHQYKGLINGVREVYRSGGVLAFFEGLKASLLQMGPQVGISFSVFSSVQPLLLAYLRGCEESECPQDASPNAHKPEHLLAASTLAGLLSGLVSKTITYPFDLVKRRMQIGSHRHDARYQVPSTSQNLIKCRQLAHCMAGTYRKEGLRGFYRGWRVTIYKAQLSSLVAFTTYELMCHGFREVSHN